MFICVKVIFFIQLGIKKVVRKAERPIWVVNDISATPCYELMGPFDTYSRKFRLLFCVDEGPLSIGIFKNLSQLSLVVCP
jgi:hypothetical protein